MPRLLYFANFFHLFIDCLRIFAFIDSFFDISLPPLFIFFRFDAVFAAAYAAVLPPCRHAG